MNDEERIRKIFHDAFTGDPVNYGYENHPTDELLQNYIADKLSEDQALIIVGHIATCIECSKRAAQLSEYHFTKLEAEEKQKKERDSGSSQILEILKRFASTRLKKHIANAIFSRLESVSEEERSKLILRGHTAIPGMAAISGRSEKNVENFLDVLQKLLPHENELNRFLEEGRFEDVRGKIRDLVGDEALADELYSYI